MKYSKLEHNILNSQLKSLLNEKDFPTYNPNTKLWKSARGQGSHIYVLTDSGVRIPLKWAFEKLHPHNKNIKFYTYQIIPFFKNKGFTIKDTIKPLAYGKVQSKISEKTRNMQSFMDMPYTKKGKLHMLKTILKNDALSTSETFKYLRVLFKPNKSMYQKRTHGFIILIAGVKHPLQRGDVFTSSKKDALLKAIITHLKM